MVVQEESGSCTGRGFADISANGFLAKFYTWITKSPASGGPGWVILHDRSTYPVAKTISAVDTGTEVITSNAHGFITGDTAVYVCTGSAISGLSNGSTYFVRKIDNNTLYLHSTRWLATTNGTPINLQSFPSGTHTLTMSDPYIIIAPSIPSGVNSISKILKIGYSTVTPAYIYIVSVLSWDDTNKVYRGVHGGFNVTMLDSANFAYTFIGGDEFLYIGSRISTSWSWGLLDEWESLTGFCEDDTVIGTVQNTPTTGVDVVVELDTGEATLFTVGHYYYIYDFNSRIAVNYVHVKDRDTINDTITLTQLWSSFSAGAIIGAYPHRIYLYGTNAGTSSYFPNIPYCSDNSSQYVFYSQDGSNYQRASLNILAGLDTALSPNDDGLYACMRPIITEYYSYGGSLAQYMNRMYGKTKNLLFSYGSMAQMLDYRIINGLNYLKLNTTLPNQLLLFSESLT